VIYDNVAALNPILVVVSILRTFNRYVGLCAFLGFVLGIGYVLQAALSALGLPLLRSALIGCGEMYATILLLRAVGWFYYCSKEQLAWD